MALPLIPIAVSFAKSQAAKFLAKRAAQRLGPKIKKSISKDTFNPKKYKPNKSTKKQRYWQDKDAPPNPAKQSISDYLDPADWK